MINSYRYNYVEGDIYVTSENSYNISVQKQRKKNYEEMKGNSNIKNINRTLRLISNTL